MNWDAIIGIAEVIGVIAIVVSLMYVAAQIRQNSEIARATIVHDTSASFMNFHQMLASDGDLAGVYYRGTNSEELSEVEKVRFHAILEMYLALLEDVDHQYKTDLYFDEDGGVDIIEFIAPTYRPLLSSPVAREWLNSLGPHSLTPSLYKKIVAIMATWDNHSKSD